MRALALLAWRRAGNRHGEPDPANAEPDDGATDEGIAIVGNPQGEAAWARFGARRLATPNHTPVRDDGAGSYVPRVATSATPLGEES
jgi:hypothetical protein